MAQTCFACGGDAIIERLDLGLRYLSGFPVRIDDRPPKFPLALVECAHCRVVQLTAAAPPDLLYAEYFYRTSTNELMVAEMADLTQRMRQELGRPVAHREWVLDIAANDGCYLRQWPKAVRRCAVEPSPTFTAELMGCADLVVAQCFPTPDLDPLKGQVACLSACAVLYASRNPRGFVEQIARLLSPDGVCAIQMQDLLQMLQAGAWDNVCMEHVAHYSLGTLEGLLDGTGLRVYDVEVRAINGGSLRFWIDRGFRSRTDRYLQWQAREAVFAYDNWDACWAHFRLRQEQSVEAIREVLEEAKYRHATVHLYGASTKSNTFVQVADLGPDLLPLAWERSPAKVGRFNIHGTPIVDEETGRALAPDFLLSGIWQFKDSTIAREAEYLRAGGKLLFGLPRLNWVQHAQPVVPIERFVKRK